MERTFPMEPNEQRALAGLDQERTQALAQVGALLLDLETARQNLTMCQEKQRTFLRTALAHRDLEQFIDARVLNGAIIVRLPDEPMPPAPAAAGPAKLNGAPQIETEN